MCHPKVYLNMWLPCWKLLNENKPKTLGLLRKVVYFWFIFEIDHISFKSFQHRCKIRKIIWSVCLAFKNYFSSIIWNLSPKRPDYLHMCATCFELPFISISKSCRRILEGSIRFAHSYFIYDLGFDWVFLGNLLEVK